MISVETLKQYSIFDHQDDAMLARIANLAEERMIEAGGSCSPRVIQPNTSSWSWMEPSS